MDDARQRRDDDEHESKGLDRRTFIASAAAAGGAVALDVGEARAALVQPLPTALHEVKVGEIQLLKDPVFSTLVRRREDLLFLRFDFYNLRRDGQKLVRKVAGRPAYVVVVHVPQHVAEQ